MRKIIMKCKEFGVKPCFTCKDGFVKGEMCTIEFYRKWIHQYEYNIKGVLFNFIKRKEVDEYLLSAIKHYYPSYIDWFQKILVLQ